VQRRRLALATVLAALCVFGLTFALSRDNRPFEQWDLAQTAVFGAAAGAVVWVVVYLVGYRLVPGSWDGPKTRVACADLGLGGCAFVASDVLADDVERELWRHLERRHEDVLGAPGSERRIALERRVTAAVLRAKRKAAAP
jgi:predicted small metal-binding protein